MDLRGGINGIKTSGLDALTAELGRLANAVGGDLTERMLDAGAEAAAEDWKEGISEAGHIDSGEMLKSVAPAPVTGKGRREVYPLGTDSKGVRNAEKAYILNYGTSKRRGDRFVDKIQKNAETDCYKAMARVFDDNMKG